MKKPTKAAGNPYCDARIEASKYNDGLSSREGASAELGIDRTRLAHVELGTKIPYPDEVVVMADTYRAPQLINYHCACECPIGKQFIPIADLCTIEQIAVRLSSTIDDFNCTQKSMIKIAEDGKVTADEMEALDRIGEILERSAKLYQELRIFIGRNAVKNE